MARFDQSGFKTALVEPCEQAFADQNDRDNTLSELRKLAASLIRTGQVMINKGYFSFAQIGPSLDAIRTGRRPVENDIRCFIGIISTIIARGIARLECVNRVGSAYANTKTCCKDQYVGQKRFDSFCGHASFLFEGASPTFPYAYLAVNELCGFSSLLRQFNACWVKHGGIARST